MQSQMLVKMENGQQVLFNMNGQDDFNEVVRRLKKWGRWLTVGSDAVIQKKTIVGMYYLPEGYENFNGTC